MDTLIVTNLGKAYKQYPTKWARLFEWFDPREKEYHNKHWILQDINFNVKAGEAIGIIGVNGAGKSTLLKMITGTTQPTVGSVCVYGRVAALLELGMGFHPDFTGRENVYMAGQLLGMTADRISELMSSILDFAEIGDYIDQPVRIYSSGMQVRLAFSLATCEKPDILIVDEALSVGDAYFQHKSFEKIKTLKSMGTTLLIVSHDKGAIQSLCDRAILLSKGRVALQGKPNEVLDFYNAAIVDDVNNQIVQQVVGGAVKTSSGTGRVRIKSCKFLNKNNKEIEMVVVSEKVRIQVESVVGSEDIAGFVVGILIKDRVGQEVFGTNTYHHGKQIEYAKSGANITVKFDFNANLGPGTYSVSIALHKTESHLSENYEWQDLALVFHVINVSQKFFIGTNWMEPEIEVEYD